MGHARLIGGPEATTYPVPSHVKGGDRAAECILWNLLFGGDGGRQTEQKGGSRHDNEDFPLY